MEKTYNIISEKEMSEKKIHKTIESMQAMLAQYREKFRMIPSSRYYYGLIIDVKEYIEELKMEQK